MPLKATKFEPHQLEALVIAPTGRDGELIVDVLKRESIYATVFHTVNAACQRLANDAGALIIAEEALNAHALNELNSILDMQDAWSDIPIIVMTGSGETSLTSLHILRAISPGGNVSLLERPFRQITLVSTLQMALRARKRQYQVRALIEKQIEATRTRDEFISIASHELKTPLTSLKLQTQMNERLIKLGNPTAYSPERVKKLVSTTNDQVDRLARLVEDMLDISRISTGKLTMHKSTVNLAHLTCEVLDRFSSQFILVGCDVRIDLDETIEGEWDRYRLEQVISNLFSNAIRYSPGTPVAVTLKNEAGISVLRVRDEGTGIAAENLDRIFQRFERAVTSGNISGLGLGLYICREIVEAHQGRIRVESQLGRGSTFIVELPIPIRPQISVPRVS